jgi:hypothetical protein
MHVAHRTLRALGATVVAGAVWLAAALPALAAAPGTTLLVNRPTGFGGANPGFTNHSGIWGDPAGTSGQSLRVVSDDDGNRYVAFTSEADGLSDQDDNNVQNVYVRDRITNTTTLVSRATGAAGAGANGSSDSPAISADGRWVAFRSSATNLSGADEGGTSQIYLRDQVNNTTTLVSRATGASGVIASSSSVEPAIAVSGGNAVVAFSSAAANLPGGNGTMRQVYLRSGSTTTLISTVNGTANPGAGSSGQPTLDATGSMVAFTSTAQLDPANDANSHEDVYRRTVANASVVLVSRVNGTGVAGNDRSEGPSASNDGSVIAFSSRATNLTAEDNEGSTDVLVRTIGGGNTMKLASRATGPGGVNSDGTSSGASLSGDGSRVVFTSYATNLVVGDNDARPDIFRRRLDADTTTIVSSGPGGPSADNTTGTSASISRNGTRAAWQGFAPAREQGDDDDFFQVYTSPTGDALPIFQPGWVSRPTGTGVFRSGVNAGVLRSPGRSEEPLSVMSADGRYTVFVSDADEMSPDDDNLVSNVYRRDNLTGETLLVSRADGPAGAAANGASGGGGSGGLGGSAPSVPAISADGRVVVFSSAATNLVAGDTNGHNDVFVRDVLAGTTVRASVGPGGAQIPFGASNPDVSGDGTKVVFTTTSAIDPGSDGNNTADVYLRDLPAGTTALVSRLDGQNTVAGSGYATDGVISDDGSTVAFESTSTDLDPIVPDGNGKVDVFIRRLAAGQTRLVSIRQAVAQTGEDSSYAPSIDATGTRVAFTSFADDLVPAVFDVNGSGRDVFVRDTVAGTTTLVSRTTGANGVSGNNGSGRQSISANGSRVAFESLSSDLVTGDINGAFDVFVRDLDAQTTELVSRTHTGTQIGAFTTNPSLSGNGDCIAFQTADASVVPGLTGTDFPRSFVRALRGDCPFGPVASPPNDPGAPGPPPPPPPASGDTTVPGITLLRAVPARFAAGK